MRRDEIAFRAALVLILIEVEKVKVSRAKVKKVRRVMVKKGKVRRVKTESHHGILDSKEV